MSLNQESMNQLAALFAQALGVNNPPADDIPPVQENEQIVAARRARQHLLRGEAHKLALGLHELFDEFDHEVVIQIASGLAWKMRDQYFFCRNQAEFHATQLAKEQEIGARVSEDVGSEVNPLAQREENVQFFNRQMEQYELALYACEEAWLTSSRALQQAGVEVSFVPDFDIGEKAFGEYVQKRIDRARARGRANNTATRQTHRLLVDTQMHFLSPSQPEAATEQ